jgi:hypothetical protein
MRRGLLVDQVWEVVGVRADLAGSESLQDVPVVGVGGSEASL